MNAQCDLRSMSARRNQIKAQTEAAELLSIWAMAFGIAMSGAFAAEKFETGMDTRPMRFAQVQVADGSLENRRATNGAEIDHPMRVWDDDDSKKKFIVSRTATGSGRVVCFEHKPDLSVVLCITDTGMHASVPGERPTLFGFSFSRSGCSPYWWEYMRFEEVTLKEFETLLKLFLEWDKRANAAHLGASEVPLGKLSVTHFGSFVFSRSATGESFLILASPPRYDRGKDAHHVVSRDEVLLALKVITLRGELQSERRRAVVVQRDNQAAAERIVLPHTLRNFDVLPSQPPPQKPHVHR